MKQMFILMGGLIVIPASILSTLLVLIYYSFGLVPMLAIISSLILIVGYAVVIIDLPEGAEDAGH